MVNRNEKGQFTKGHKLSQGENNPFYGKKHSEETKKKMRLNGKANLTGIENGKKTRFEKGHKGFNSFLGRKHTEETKRKMRLSGKNKNKGIPKPPFTEEHKRNISLSHRGKKPSEETRRKMSQSQKGKHVGEKCHWWKGGITPINQLIRSSVEYRLWREAVYSRDNYTCRFCGKRSKDRRKLNADHIKPFADYPELRFAIDNGRTLCVDCHKKTETYGKRKT